MEKFVIPADVKGLIFDCDGTIADTMPLHYKAYEKALGKDAKYFSKEMFFEQAGVPAAQVMALLKKERGLDFDPDQVAEHKEKLYGEMLQSVNAIPAVEQAVRENAGRYPMAVASGGTHENVEKTLKLLGLTDFFKTVVSADEVTHGKPAPDMFLEAARRLEIAPAHILVFEDGEKGFEAAEAAGMKWVDVRPWYTDDQWRG